MIARRRWVTLGRRAAPALACAVAGLLAACTQPIITVEPAPIAVRVEGGVIASQGAVESSFGFPLLIDSGSPLTAWDPAWSGAAPSTGASQGTIRMLASDGTPRLEIDDVLLYRTPLSAVGLEGALFPSAGALGGVLGGDNLSRFAVVFDLRPSPQLTFLPAITTCGCDLADACQAVFPFTLGGGAQHVAVGQDVFSVPPTRVIVDACLEPIVDPVSRDVACVHCASCDDPRGDCPFDDAYLPSGIDVKLVVATGFPGLGLGSTVYDRLRGTGAAAAKIGAGTTLQLPSGETVPVGMDQLGSASRSAVALVSREIYFGPCDELARSRRLRRYPPGAPIASSDPRFCEQQCLIGTDRTDGPAGRLVQSCVQQAAGSDICDDGSQSARAAAVSELTAPMPVLVLDAASSILTAVNEDLRPTLIGADPGPVVEGVIGVGALSSLVATLDYPNRRMIARCAAADGCVSYPRFWNGGECSRTCTSIQTTWPPGKVRPGNDVGTPGSEQLPPSPLPGALCPPADARP